MPLSKKALIKRVVKMIEHPKFGCAHSCPLFKYYSTKNDYIKGLETGRDDICIMCCTLFGRPDWPTGERTMYCPCTQWGHNIDAVRKHVYRVAKEHLR